MDVVIVAFSIPLFLEKMFLNTAAIKSTRVHIFLCKCSQGYPSGTFTAVVFSLQTIQKLSGKLSWP